MSNNKSSNQSKYIKIERELNDGEAYLMTVTSSPRVEGDVIRFILINGPVSKRKLHKSLDYDDDAIRAAVRENLYSGRIVRRPDGKFELAKTVVENPQNLLYRTNTNHD